MFTLKQIHDMTPAECNAASKRLIGAIVLKNVVLPLAAAAAVNLVAKVIAKRAKNA